MKKKEKKMNTQIELATSGECSSDNEQYSSEVKYTPGYYSILTPDVRYDPNLTGGAKLLYAEITSLSNQFGYCWASNNYFATLYSKTKTTISIWISSLVNGGYIYTEIDKNNGNKRKIYIINRKPIKNYCNTYSNIINDPIKEIFNDNNKTKKYNKTNIPDWLIDIKKTQDYQRFSTELNQRGWSGSVDPVIIKNNWKPIIIFWDDVLKKDIDNSKGFYGGAWIRKRLNEDATSYYNTYLHKLEEQKKVLEEEKLSKSEEIENSKLRGKYNDELKFYLTNLETSISNSDRKEFNEYFSNILSSIYAKKEHEQAKVKELKIFLLGKYPFKAFDEWVQVHVGNSN
jgi:hypothetical protein